MSATSRSACPGSRSWMNQAFSANRQASRNSGLPCASHDLADRVQVGQRHRLPAAAVVGDRHEHDRDVVPALAQQRVQRRDVHVALERVVGLRVAALRDDQVDGLRPGVLDVGPGGVEVRVVRHDLPGPREHGEEDLLGRPALVGGDDVLEREQLAHGVAEHVVRRRAGVGLVAVLDRRPLVAAHRAGARVGEQVDQHVLGVHLEQVVAGPDHGRLRCCARGHPQRLHRVDPERLDDRAEGRCAHARDGTRRPNLATRALKCDCR